MYCPTHSASAARTSHCFFAGPSAITPRLMNRVAITGIGIVAPGAVGIEPFRAMLDAGTTAVQPIDRFDTEGLAAHSAALVRDFKARDYIPAMKMRRMNTLSRYAVSAARLAIADADADSPLSSDSGVAIGTAFGPVQ